MLKWGTDFMDVPKGNIMIVIASILYHNLLITNKIILLGSEEALQLLQEARCLPGYPGPRSGYPGPSSVGVSEGYFHRGNGSISTAGASVASGYSNGEVYQCFYPSFQQRNSGHPENLSGSAHFTSQGGASSNDDGSLFI